MVGEKGKVAKGLNIGVFVAGNNECVPAMDAIENFLSGSDFLDLCRNDQIASLGFVIFFWEMSGQIFLAETIKLQVVSEFDFSKIFENCKYLFNLTNRTIALHIRFWKTRQIVQIIL